MNSPRSSVPAPLDSEFDSESDHPPSLPAIDERLVAPESDAEIIDGIVYDTPGADQAHGTLHFDAAHLFAGVLADGYAGAVNMLSRLDELSDAAPDISVFPALPDPKTEGRQLEEIVVEVLDTERVGRATTKVEKFAARGVRRLFAVRVASRKVYEWDHADHDWIEFTDDAVITDPCFRVPVPARALIDRVLARDTVAEALIERDHRVIVEALAQAAGILAFATVREVPDESMGLYMVGIDEARFRRPVVPGDQLILTAQLARSFRGIWRFSTTAFVGGEEVSSANIMVATELKTGKP
jgi:hypothetical protein